MTDKAFLKRLSKSSKYPMKDLQIILDLAEIQLKQDLLNGYQKFRVCDLMFSTKQFAERRTKYFGKQEILIPPMIKVRISMSKDWTDLFAHKEEYVGQNLFALSDEQK